MQLQREIEQRRTRHDPSAAFGRFYVAGFLELREQSCSSSTRKFRELVAVDDARAVLGPWRGECRVDAEPLTDGAGGTTASDQVADCGEGEAAIAQFGDEVQPLLVIVGVDGVAPSLRRFWE